MKKLFFLNTLLVICLMYSCKKADVNPLDSDLEFQFRLLDKNGQVSTSFKQGENLRFSFLIVNKTQKGWGLLQESLNFNDDFFRVYQNFGDKKNMGRPLVSPVFTEKIPFIPVSGTLKLEMDWIPDSNAYYPRFSDNYHLDNLRLPSGKYRTGFTAIFSFRNGGTDTAVYKTESKSFNIDFEVK